MSLVDAFIFGAIIWTAAAILVAVIFSYIANAFKGRGN